MKFLKILVFLVIITNFILVGFLLTPTSYTINERTKINVTRVIDGDTLDSDIGKIRLLGVNTPEKNQKYFSEAKSFLGQYENQTLEAELNGKDAYNRTLSYVFYKNKNINEQILLQGLGHLYVYDKDSYYENLEKAESEARALEIGIWKKSQDSCSLCISLVKLNEVDPGEYAILKNTCSYECNLNKWTIKDNTASHLYTLNFSLQENEIKQIDFKGSIWNDNGDSFFLRDEKELLVLFYRY